MVAVLVLVISLPEPAGIRANPAKPKRVSARHRFTCPKRSGLEPGDPCRISIPSIKVVAKVIRLGLNPDGTLEVPSDFSVTGWWSGGARPGKIGPNAVQLRRSQRARRSGGLDGGHRPHQRRRVRAG